VTYRILLIDGDAARAAKRRAPLAEAGHDVTVAGGPDAALLSFDRAKPNLVVIDATEREDTIRDLCGLLKKKAAEVPLALLTDVVNDPQQVSLLLNHYGCDQLIDRSLAPERMLRLIEQLVTTGARGAGPRPREAGADPGGTTLWLDSEELVNALEKLDTIITHKAASQVQAPAASEILAHVDSQLDRDVAARGDAEAADGGADIDDHLDSVFKRGLGGVAQQPAAAKATPPAAPRDPVVVKATQAAKATTASIARDPGATMALPVPPRPAPVVTNVKPTPAPQPAAAEATRSDVAVGVSSQAPASTVRWLIAATVVVTLLGAGYLMLFRGSHEPAVASVATGGTSPAQVPPFTPAADRAADPTDDVRSAGASVPVTPPASAAPAPSPQPSARPVATPKPKVESTPTKPKVAPAKPKVESTPPKPKIAPAAPTVAATTPLEPPPKPKVEAIPPEPKVVPTAPASATAVAMQGVSQAAAPEPTPVPAARETAPTPAPTPAPLVAAAEPAPVKAEPSPIVPPTVLKRVEPTFSPKALKGVDNPRVALRVLVDAQGRITRVLVDKGIPGSELEAAAVSAVLRWQFQPASRDGAPVEAWTTAEFKFGQ